MAQGSRGSEAEPVKMYFIHEILGKISHLVFVTSRLIVFVQVALESKRFVTTLALVVLE